MSTIIITTILQVKKLRHREGTICQDHKFSKVEELRFECRQSGSKHTLLITTVHFQAS